MHPTSFARAARVRRSATATATACAVAFALVCTATGSAQAQTAAATPTGTLRFDEAGALALALIPSYGHGQADVGRLKGTLLSLPGNPNANQAIDMFCVDLLHDVTFRDNGWNVYLNNLGDPSSVATTREGGVVADALTRYRKAAWLTDQYAQVTTLADTAGIQAAMWLQFVPTLTPFTFADASEANATAAWTTAANRFAATAAFDAYNWSRFTVLTDVNSVGAGEDGDGFQEQITSEPLTTTTPEPTTLALLGVSLAGLAAAARRRGPRRA